MTNTAGDVSIDVIQKKILENDSITIESDYFAVWVEPLIKSNSILTVKATGTLRVMG